MIKACDLDATKPFLRIRQILHSLRPELAEVKFADIELTGGEALYVWLQLLLEMRQPVSVEEIHLIMTSVKTQVVAYGDCIYKIMMESMNSSTKSSSTVTIQNVALSIFDNTILCLVPDELFIDLRTGDRIERLPQIPIEAVSYNLTALLAMHARRLKMLETVKQHEDSHADKSASDNSSDSTR